MRILFIPSWYPTSDQPFNGSFFREQAIMLADAGHDVTVLSPRMVPLGRWRGHRTHIEDDRGIRVIRLDIPAVPRGLQRFDEQLFTRAALSAHSASGTTIPDVIHAHSVMPASILAKELAIRWGRPHVITEHRPSSLNGSATGPRGRSIIQSVKDAAVVATVSRPFSDALAAHYGVDSVGVIDLPVPDSFFMMAPSSSKGRPAYTFLHVSHLDRNKRVEETIAAFSRVDAQRECRLVIAGGTPERVHTLRTVAAQHGVEERVELLGRIPRGQLPGVMANAHCLVLASAVEAGGTVISEAKAMGMAVVATETWAGQHGVDPSHGSLVPVDDSDALPSAMKRAVVQEQGYWARDRERIRECARQRYSSSAFVARQERMYEQAISRGERARMIFHTPYPIDPNPSAASRLRPKSMLQAFKELGLQVQEISGTPRQRAVGYRDAKKRQRYGQDIAFAYSENSTQPNIFATSLRMGIAPLLEARLFRWAQRSGIPVGEFYRDIYWRFSANLGVTLSPRRLLMQLAYRFDLAVLKAAGVHLFLPSARMGPVLPYPSGRYSALPPGTEVRESTSPDVLHLFYVGGLGPEYGLHTCVEAVAENPAVTLTMCVPERDWLRNADAYSGYLGERVRVVHAASEELGPYYDAASACVLFVEPSEYRKFAAPVKFFEYLGYGKPILLSEGTLASELGSQLGNGIEIPYTKRDFARTLAELIKDPSRLQLLAERAREVRHDHSWQKRAATATDVLRPELVQQLSPAV